MVSFAFSLLSFGLVLALGQSQFVPLPGANFVPGNLAFGANCKSKGCGFQQGPGNLIFGGKCKSKGCGIQQGPFGPVYFGGACKSKGCPLPPGLKIPGVPTTPLPPAPPVCCGPDGCLNGHRTECLAGPLTPRLRAQGFFVASGSCSGRLRKFNCKSARNVCTGNRRRCVFRKCKRKPNPRPSKRPSPSPPAPTRPTPRPKTKPYSYSYRMAAESEEDDNGPVVDTNDRYFQLIDRMINISRTGGDDTLPTSVRQFGFGACKSKSCPFGVFPDGNAPGGGQFVFGGACKSKGCGIVRGPQGLVYFGGACKSKGCPLPPDFTIPGSPTPNPSPSAEPKLPPNVPPFKPPRKRDCCFARPCKTQRICRCVLNK